MTVFNMNRRGFLKSSAMLGGGLLLGCTIPGQMMGATQEKMVEIGAWIRIASDESITVVVPSSEMGQGVTTSLPMLVADDLEADWNAIKIELAPANPVYNNPNFRMQLTGGSNSIRGFWESLCKVGASAREMLVTAAANRWDVTATECEAQAGKVIHKSSGRSLTYGVLADDASKLDVPQNPKLKNANNYRLVGKAIKRLDTPDKTQGTAVFGVDVIRPGMLIATVKTAPVFGEEVQAMNEAAAKAVKGVHAVVPIPNGVAVVAENYWQAKKGIDALKVQFSTGENNKVDDGTIQKTLAAAMDEKMVVEEKIGDYDNHVQSAKKVLDLEYHVPFLAHATMEPMNCTADVKPGGCEVWAATQAPGFIPMVASKISGVPREKIKVHTTYLGGGFGRRGEMDVVVQALIISKAVGRPVKMIWSREEDIQHDFYRPASLSRFQIGLDQEGMPMAWNHQIVCPSIFARINPAAVRNGVDFTIMEGAKHLPYMIPNQKMESVIKNMHVPVGFWRSVGSSHNAFYTESAMDEAAHAAGKDPYQYRRQLMANHPRFLNVLDKAASEAGWSKPIPQGQFRGIAIAKSFDSIVAQVAEVSVSPDGQVRVHRVVCVVDCGKIVNPDTIQAQMEGGIVYGLTAALTGEISIQAGQVVQSNFHDYTMLKMADMPIIETHIVQSTEAPGGVGEPGTPPIAPAVTNAIFAATGKRLRSLPIAKHDLKKA